MMNGKYVNLMHLEYFCTIVETGSISAAAKQLYISQQAVSSSIIRLERDLGIKLFNRTPSLTLTSIGETVYSHTQQILQRRDLLLREIDLYKEGKNTTFTVGAAPCRAHYIFPKILEEVTQTFPSLELLLVERPNSEELERCLLRDEIDFAIGPISDKVNPEIESIPIYQESLSLVVPTKFMQKTFGPQYQQWQKEFEIGGAHVDRLRDNPFFLPKSNNKNRAAFDSFLKSKNLTLPVVLESDNIETLLSFAVHGQCITIFPELLLKKMAQEMSSRQLQRIQIFKVNDNDIYTTQGISFRKSRVLTRDEKRLVEIFKSACSSIFAEES